MKVAITGHSKGIGAAIANILHDHEVVGFSRVNGYDLADQNTVSRIVEQAADCDVFVNNAYYETAQTHLFEKILKLWHQNNDKTIVNINSRTIYSQPNPRQYCADKKLLRASAVNAIRDISRKCRVININPGYVKTDMVKIYHEKYSMLEPEKVAEVVKWCLCQPQDIEIGELGIWCTTLDK